MHFDWGFDLDVLALDEVWVEPELTGAGSNPGEDKKARNARGYGRSCHAMKRLLRQIDVLLLLLIFLALQACG